MTRYHINFQPNRAFQLISNCTLRVMTCSSCHRGPVLCTFQVTPVITFIAAATQCNGYGYGYNCNSYTPGKEFPFHWADNHDCTKYNRTAVICPIGTCKDGLPHHQASLINHARHGMTNLLTNCDYLCLTVRPNQS